MANYMTAIREIEQIVDNTPELNINNYDEIQVDELNSAMIEICNILGNLAECESQEATNEAKAALPIQLVSNSVCDCKAKEPCTFTEHGKIVEKCVNCGKPIANDC